MRDTDYRGFQPVPPFQFDFRDENGVALRLLPATYEGSLVGLEGLRLWVVLKLPEGRLMQRTAKVVVDPKPYGSYTPY